MIAAGYYEQENKKATARLFAIINELIPDIETRQKLRRAAIEYGNERGRLAAERTIESFR